MSRIIRIMGLGRMSSQSITTHIGYTGNIESTHRIAQDNNNLKSQLVPGT